MSYMISSRKPPSLTTCLQPQMKHTKGFRELTHTGSLIALLAGLMTGCGASDDDEKIARAVYIDLATKRAVVADVAKVYPAVHPVTGDTTLMPAMHCPRCDQWRQVPLPEQVNQMSQTLQCFKCKTALSPDGPFPPEALAEADRNQDQAP